MAEELSQEALLGSRRPQVVVEDLNAKRVMLPLLSGLAGQAGLHGV